MQKTNSKKKEEVFIEDVVKEVIADFEERRKERLSLERQWELNINFLSGNQYCDIGLKGDISEENSSFYWQERKVFNHIAPLIESRLARFSHIEPSVSVRPKSDDDSDVYGATIAEKLISQAFKRSDIHTVVKKATAWSEACGTGFYKVVWNNFGGEKIGEVDGKSVYEGEAEIYAVSPFEIFPDSLFTENVEDCESIIHARAMTVQAIKEKYGVEILGEEIGVFNLTKGKNGALNKNAGKNVLKNAATVIEKYEKPTSKYPKGRLITVAGGKLLYYGELPYNSGEDYTPSYPFIKQECAVTVGSFFGQSLIERMIPIQRAFNAVKNRKHEFLNRLSTGIMTVEDGSLDTDDLAEEGLSPGKVLVYRQGSKAPEMLDGLDMPDDFNKEEEKLLNEFVIISGVSDVTSSTSNASLTSGSALQILVEQDNERLLMAAEEIRKCYVLIAKKTIRLYAQFMAGVKAIKSLDSFNKMKVFYADKNAVRSDDCYLDSENELLYTNSQKKEMIFKLYESGLLADGKGELRPQTKEKVLSLLGYKDLDYRKGISRLQEEKAQGENEKIRKDGLNIEEIDDDTIHIDEHTRYILSEYDELNDGEKTRLYAHLKAHKDRINLKEKGE